MKLETMRFFYMHVYSLMVSNFVLKTPGNSYLRRYNSFASDENERHRAR